MEPSSGKLTFSRLEICSGLQHVTRRRSCRRGLFRPFHSCACGSRHDPPSGGLDGAGQPVLHVLAEPIVLDRFRCLRPPGSALGVPLRHRCPILHRIRPRGRVPPYLPRDGRWRTPQAPRNLPHAGVLYTQQRDLLTLRERKITTRHRRGKTRSPRRPGETSEPHRRRHPDLGCGILCSIPARSPARTGRDPHARRQSAALARESARDTT